MLLTRMQKNLRILFSQNVVIGQCSSKCPGLNVHIVSLNKACRFAVIFTHTGISVLLNCISMICRLSVGSYKQRVTWQVKNTFTRVMSDK